MSALQRVTDTPEHLSRVECSQPVAVGVCIVVAGSSAMALDEGNLPKVLQAGTRRGQWLARALRPHPSFLWMQLKLKCHQNHHNSCESEHYPLTITKEYPSQRGRHPAGQSGTWLV